jgi:class 3 adenylate cyclase
VYDSSALSKTPSFIHVPSISVSLSTPHHSALEVTHTTAHSVELETDKVIFTLLKVGNLLKSSLGEAGLDIISANLADTSKPFDPMIPGRRVQAAFSFCDVRRFTDATECLEEEVMTFVNTIAAIVHGAAVATGGAPNKNVGDAFLCVWRSTAAEAAAARARVSFADRALSAAAAVLRDVRRSERLGRFASDARIVARLGDAWRVRLGFGLHCGWAIEGAIGTRHKARACACALLRWRRRVLRLTRMFVCAVPIVRRWTPPICRRTSTWRRAWRAPPSSARPRACALPCDALTTSLCALSFLFLSPRYGVPILLSDAFVDALLLEEHITVRPRPREGHTRGRGTGNELRPQNRIPHIPTPQNAGCAAHRPRAAARQRRAGVALHVRLRRGGRLL